MLAGPLRRLGPIFVLALAATLMPALTSADAQGPSTRGEILAAAPGDRATPATFRALRGFDLDTIDRVRVAPRIFAAFRLAREQTALRLAKAPGAAATRAGAAPLRFAVPAPDGSLQIFAVAEDSVMEPGLAAAHPELRTYAGNGVTDPRMTIRLDLTPMGFHASVRDPEASRAWYVDPVKSTRGATTHLSYYGAAVPRSSKAFVERNIKDTRSIRQAALRNQAAALAPGDVVTRRTYKMAFVTDPTYAAAFGTANVLAEKVTQINRVNQIYNDDLAMQYVLVDGTDKLNLDTFEKATGPNGPCGANACYELADIESCSGATLSRNKFVLGQIVGADTFDIGHIGLGTDGGGVANLGVVGGARKASGCTGVDPPKGDLYAVDYFAHEVGHQMGGNHTWSGAIPSCAAPQRNQQTAIEPGSGSSVMAYAGICGQDDLQPHSDPYFSLASTTEITAVAELAPVAIAEQQVVNLAGFDGSESFDLTYPGQPAVTITNGVNYNNAGLRAAILTLTGKDNAVSGYDGSADAGPAGFTVRFTLPEDLQRLGVANPSLGVTSFTGVLQNGGPITNGGATNATANRSPTIVAPEDRTIPVQTPFTLTGSGSDPDEGTTLTYLWEQNDATVDEFIGRLLASNAKIDGPLFRMFGIAAPVTPEGTMQYESPGENLADGNPSRTFPDLAQVLAGNTNAELGICPPPPPNLLDQLEPMTLDCYSEFLPTPAYALASGALNFRLTGRDGFAAGGGTGFDEVVLTIDPGAGPFLVTSRSSAGTPVAGNSMETVEWDAAGTQALAPNVKITLSTDGGQTFPHVLAASTANDGSEAVLIPDVGTTTARIKIEAVDNYFFDVNDAEFAIEGGPTTDIQTRIIRGPAPFSFVLSRGTRIGYASTPEASSFKCRLDRFGKICRSPSVFLSPLTQGMHTFKVRAVDSNGVADPTPARRRFASPFKAESLAATGGWTTRSDADAYRASYRTVKREGAQLAKRVTGITRVALVVGTGPGYGRVQVFLDNRRLGTVSLSSRKVRERVLVPIEGFKTRQSGKIRIVTLDGKTVRIEGLGLINK